MFRVQCKGYISCTHFSTMTFHYNFPLSVLIIWMHTTLGTCKSSKKTTLVCPSFCSSRPTASSALAWICYRKQCCAAPVTTAALHVATRCYGTNTGSSRTFIGFAHRETTVAWQIPWDASIRVIAPSLDMNVYWFLENNETVGELVSKRKCHHRWPDLYFGNLKHISKRNSKKPSATTLFQWSCHTAAMIFSFSHPRDTSTNSPKKPTGPVKYCNFSPQPQKGQQQQIPQDLSE